MKHVEKYTVIKKEIKAMTCDKCGKYYDDEFEIQEFFYLVLTGGYSSIFGDGVTVEADICQYCLKEIIGEYCRMS